MLKKLVACLLMPLLLFGGLSLAFAEDAPENLALGLTYVVETGEPVKYSYWNYTDENIDFDEDLGQLTDGNTAAWTDASTAAGSSVWYRAFRGQSRIITLDLGAQCAVSGVSAGFLHQKGLNIYAPRYINVRLSDNGVDFQLIKEYNTEFPLYTDETLRYSADISLGRVYSARYVQVEFCCDYFCYCDEISVLGSKTLSGKEKAVKPDAKAQPKGYLKSINGISSVVKLDADENITQQQLLPYVAYINTSGDIAGRMFDAVAFSVPNSNNNVSMSDWEQGIEKLFSDGVNLSALDNTAGGVYTALDIDDSFNVFLTIPYPAITSLPFGDIDGDGVENLCQTLDERVRIIEWYIDKCIARFKESEYANLKLAGFYWGGNKVDYAYSDHEEQLIKSINKYIKGKKLASVLDAEYLSAGFENWQELGFGGAVMQPNLASDKYSCFETSMLSEFAVSAYNNRLGAVIETALPDAFDGEGYLEAGKKYECYLYYGYKQGYMYALNTYCQGAGVYYSFCYADTSTPKGIYLRRLYDLTYAFINGTYKNDAPVVSIDDIELVKGDDSMVADVAITDSDSYWEDITLEFPQMPSNGVVAAASGKNKIIYTPNADFVGEDSFTVVACDGFNRSEEITVRVTVTEPEIPFASAFSDDNNNVSKRPNVTEERPVWLIPLLAALASAMVIVAVVTIVKKRKK